MTDSTAAMKITKTNPNVQNEERFTGWNRPRRSSVSRIVIPLIDIESMLTEATSGAQSSPKGYPDEIRNPMRGPLSMLPAFPRHSHELNIKITMSYRTRYATGPCGNCTSMSRIGLIEMSHDTLSPSPEYRT
jgi:hypothetical protein